MHVHTERPEGILLPFITIEMSPEDVIQKSKADTETLVVRAVLPDVVE